MKIFKSLSIILEMNKWKYIQKVLIYLQLKTRIFRIRILNKLNDWISAKYKKNGDKN